jgi:genome maintenance exonuclease 1
MFNHVELEKVFEVEAITEEGIRHYPCPKGNYPSVTTVISNNPEKIAGIMRWRKRVGEEKANRVCKRATTRGNDYHLMAELYLKNTLVEGDFTESPLSAMMFQSTKETLNNINNIYLQEAVLYSDILQIAGRVDCIAEYEGELAIIDFKTSGSPKKESYLYDYYVQEQAYACMFYEMYGLTVKKLVTIIACEDGDTQIKINPPRKEYYLKLKEYIAAYHKNARTKSGG